VTGQEDHSIALDLSAELSKVDSSGQISSVIVSGVPDGFTLSHSTPMEGGQWQVPLDKLSEVQITPPRDWNGTLQLTLHATSMEPLSDSTATATAPFTVTITPVNDAPELALTAPSHSDAGTSAVSAMGSVQAHDIDSTYLGGATVTLTSAHSGDRLDFEGFILHNQNGRLMIEDTGIEVLGGGYDTLSRSLTLSGNASPDTYAKVLQSLVLESADGSNLAPGTRSIEVTLTDSERAVSAPRAVDVIVEDPVPPPSEAPEGIAAMMSTPQHDHLGADVLLLVADTGSETADTSHNSWTEQVGQSADPAAASYPSADLDQPTAEHIHPVNDFHADIGRVNWS
jgi:hypothetical protein